jgi:hypothetical protein
VARAGEVRAELARDGFEEAVEEHPFDPDVA